MRASQELPNKRPRTSDQFDLYHPGAVAEDWQSTGYGSSMMRVAPHYREQLEGPPDLQDVIRFTRSIYFEGNTLPDGYYASTNGEILHIVDGLSFQCFASSKPPSRFPLFDMESLPRGTTTIANKTHILFVEPGTQRPEDMLHFILGGERNVLCSYLCENGSLWGLVAGLLLEKSMYRRMRLHFPLPVVNEWGVFIQDILDRRERDLTGSALSPHRVEDAARHNILQRAAFAAFFQGTGTSALGNHIAPVRNLTGSHGVRPIRVRLIGYLVISRLWRAAFAQRADQLV